MIPAGLFSGLCSRYHFDGVFLYSRHVTLHADARRRPMTLGNHLVADLSKINKHLLTETRIFVSDPVKAVVMVDALPFIHPTCWEAVPSASTVGRPGCHCTALFTKASVFVPI